ncbi:MAG: hypothetical protein LBM04_07540 [Opitutaceae bacterium]|jgi:phosphatidylglycerophosphate synthase|nr:hypothetical protein [Opitutaceae bacterium]
MKHFWPYWILPLAHFALVAVAAFGVHYSNGINVHGFDGDYGYWMDVGFYGGRAFQFSRWAVPIALFLVLFRSKEKKRETAWFIAAALPVIGATWTLYSGLVRFWERAWIPA